MTISRVRHKPSDFENRRREARYKPIRSRLVARISRLPDGTGFYIDWQSARMAMREAIGRATVQRLKTAYASDLFDDDIPF